MFSPEERARIESEAAKQRISIRFVQQYDVQPDAAPLRLDADEHGHFSITRDDKAFLKQNHISPE